ncbi:MAG: hypothetical protein ABIH20_00965 [Candidatus Diapherotrites archaeon]
MVFRRKLVRPLEEHESNAFWTAHEMGKFETQERVLDSTHRAGQRVVNVRRGVLGTVRDFASKLNLRIYVAIARAVEEVAKKGSFKTFDLIPLEILSVQAKRGRLLERVYPSPNLFQVKEYLKSSKVQSRYHDFFLKRFKEWGISKEELLEKLTAFERNFSGVLKEHGINYDPNEANILLHDYDPKTGRFLVSLTDYVYEDPHKPMS